MSISMLENSDARLGFSLDPSSISPSCTNGPYRPVSARTGSWCSGSTPSTRGPAAPFSSSSSAFSIVSSSGARSTGTGARSSPRTTLAPLFQTRTMMSRPSASRPIGTALTSAGSIVARCSSLTRSLRPVWPLPNQNAWSHFSASPSPRAIASRASSIVAVNS